MLRSAAAATLLLVFVSCTTTGQTEACKASARCEASLALKTGTLGTEALHGPNGSCWTDPITAAACDTDCKNGLAAAQQSSSTNKLPGCEPGGIPFDGGTLCASSNGGCATEATCLETNGSVSCTCNPGFTGNGMTCADLDECLTNNGGCPASATCTNLPGSRTCACNAPFVGDGGTCMVPSPVPTLTRLSRVGIPAGAGQTTLVLTGTNFAPNGTVQFGGVTLFASVTMGTTATCTIPTSSLSTAGPRQVTFVNPAPGGGASNALTFNVLTDAPAILASGLAFTAALAVDATDLYFAASDAGTPYTVSRMPKAGGALTPLAPAQRNVTELFVDDAAVYWCHTGDIQLAGGFVRRVGLTGGAVTTMASEPTGLKGMTVDATNVYFVDNAANLKRVGLASATPATIGAGYGAPQTALFFDNDATQLYFGQSYFSSVGLWHAPKTGGSPISYSLTGRNVAVDATDLYFITYVGPQPTTLQKMPKAGGTATTLFVGLVNPNDLAVDASGVYVSDSNGVHHLSKSGGGLTTLTTRTAIALALDSSAVYFVGVGPSVIGRIAKQGTASIASISPQSANVGSPDVTLTLTLSSAPVAGAVVSANGTALVTTGQTAVLPASFLATAGTVAITVTNPGAGPSAPVLFTVNNLVPSLTAITPTNVDQYSGNTAIALTGTNFAPGGKAFLGATELATTVGSATAATATIPSALLTTSGTQAITFVNPAPGGGASTAQTFTINAVAGNPLPIVTVNVSPAEVRVGSSGLYLQISVDPASVLASTEVLNGLTPLPTDTRQRASGILLAYLANVGPAGMIDVNVSNPPPAGGRTFAGGITVLTTGNALPTVTAMTPSMAAASAADTTVTLDGTNFVTGGKVVIRSFPNQVTLTPGAVSATQVTFTLPAAQLTTAASFSVVYVNPSPGGGNSAAQTFTVQ